MARTMPKKLDIDEKRILVLKKNEIKLFENKSMKVAMSTYPRWASFRMYLDEIDEAVVQFVAKDQDVKLQLSIGGACTLT